MKLGSAFQKVNFLRDIKPIKITSPYHFPNEISHGFLIRKENREQDIEEEFKIPWKA